MCHTSWDQCPVRGEDTEAHAAGEWPVGAPCPVLDAQLTHLSSNQDSDDTSASSL